MNNKKLRLLIILELLPRFRDFASGIARTLRFKRGHNPFLTAGLSAPSFPVSFSAIRAFLLTAWIFTIVCASAVYPLGIDAVPPMPPKAPASIIPLLHDDLVKGLNFIYHDRFETGLELFEKVRKTHPDHPAPYFFKAAAYQSWMNTFRINTYQQLMEEHINLTIEKGNERLKTENNAWIHFFIGAAHGYRAFNRFRKYEWIGAYLDATRGVNYFQTAMETDPSIYDVYLGLGSYHYWRTAKSKFLRVIAFWIPDKRELGLRQLDFTRQYAVYARDEAVYNLIVAYYDSGLYDEALSVIDQNIKGKLFPNVADLYYKGRLLIKFERWPEVESVFKSLIRRLEYLNCPTPGYQAECKYWIALSLKKQNRRKEAFEWLEAALSQNNKRTMEIEINGPLESYEETEANMRILYNGLSN